MLERDPGLKAIAESKGLRPEDTRSIESMIKVLKIKESADRFANNVSKRSITEDEQIDGVTDMYMMMLITDREERSKDANRTDNPYFMNEYNAILNEILNSINTVDDLRAMDLQSLLYDKAGYLDYKYSPNTPLLESFNDPKNIDKLRNTVREMVKNSTLNAPYSESRKILLDVKKYKLVTDMIKNYEEKAPVTDDGLYDMGIKNGFIRSYIDNNKDEARERMRLADSAGFDDLKLSNLRDMVDKKLKNQGVKKTTVTTTNVNTNNNKKVEDNTIKHI